MKKLRSLHRIMVAVFPLLVIVCSYTHGRAQNARNGENSRQAVRAFVTNWGGTDVSVIDPERGRLIANIKTGSQPHGVAIAPDGRAGLRLERR